LKNSDPFPFASLAIPTSASFDGLPSTFNNIPLTVVVCADRQLKKNIIAPAQTDAINTFFINFSLYFFAYFFLLVLLQGCPQNTKSRHQDFIFLLEASRDFLRRALPYGISPKRTHYSCYEILTGVKLNPELPTGTTYCAMPHYGVIVRLKRNNCKQFSRKRKVNPKEWMYSA
jgi:hypothetical protein